MKATKVVIYVVIAAVAVVVLFFALLGAWNWYSVRNFNEESVRRAYVIEYSEQEQKREGVDCRKLKERINSFLEGTIEPLRLSSAVKGKTELPDVKRQTDAIFTCSRLYEIGKNGELNGLQDAHFAKSILEDFVRMDTIVRFTLTSAKCDDKCLTSALDDINTARKSVIAKMK